MQKSFFRNLITGCLAAVLTLSLCAGTAMAAPENETDRKVGITKTLKIAEGITTPDATFTFNFVEKGDAPVIPDATVSYSAEDKPGAGTSTLTKDSNNIFQGVEFKHAGEYKYTVSESKTGFTATEGVDEMTYDQTSYEMTVLVKNKTGEAGGVYITDVFFAKLDENQDPVGEKESGTQGTGENEDTNYYNLFTNTYTKKAGTIDPENPDQPDPDAKSLTIGKEVAGEYADKTKDFTFNVTLTRSSTDKAESYIGKVEDTDYTFVPDIATTVTLRHGQSLTFDNLPAGTKYNVTETGTENYSAVYAGKANGEAISGSAEKAADLTALSILVGEKTNNNTYTNTYDDASISPTGIIVNNLPFIMMILVAVLAFVGYVFNKKRNNVR